MRERTSQIEEIEAEWEMVNGQAEDNPNQSAEQSEKTLDLPEKVTDNTNDVIEKGKVATPDDESSKQQERSESELKEHLMRRFQEIFREKWERVKKLAGARETDEPETKIMILLNSLKELASDPAMPEHLTDKLKHVLRTLEIGPGPLRPPQPGRGIDSESDAAISVMKRRDLLEQLRRIFPEEFIAYIESI